ncbi:hypothetical protein SprV_0501859200 [Sparganum proliferum]
MAVMHPRRLLEGRRAEGVGQEKIVFRKGLQEKRAVAVEVADPLATEHSLLGGVFCMDEGIEVIKDNQFARLQHDNPRSNRPERRTALVARELARYKVDIAALSETRFSEQGQLEEVGAGYTFF